MTKSVEFLFDIVSPAAYIAWHVIPKIASAAGAELIETPVFLGGVMQATGNRPPGTVEAKKRWMTADLARWAGLYGLDYRRPDKHPQNTLAVMRAMIAWQGTDRFRPMGDALFRAMHVENADLEDPATLAALLGPLGITPADFMAKTQDPAIKARLKENTDQAVARGMFGAPTFLIGETLHFGQDRLWMVAEDLGTDIHKALADAS